MQTVIRRSIRKKIGELLIERGTITPEKLEKALREQAAGGGYISQHLISMGFASEADIAHCLSVQYNFGYLPVENYKIPPHLLDVIPLKLIKIFSILPLDKTDRLLTVAMADPLNEGIIEILRQITNCEVEVFISTYSELSLAISRYFAKKMQDMDKYAISEEDLIKEGVVRPFIQTVGYSGQERRRYQRINVELDMEYFLYGKIFKARVKNMSYLGIYFVCPSFIPLDTNILSKIHIKERPIDVVVQVVRVEKMEEGDPKKKDDPFVGGFGIAGFFNFLTEDDKKKLISFLKEKDNP